MMLPNQVAMATTRPGGSVHQLMVARPSQAHSFGRAQDVPTMTQGINGFNDAARQAAQAGRTEQHAMVQAAQNFGPQVSEHEARNAQKIAEQKITAYELSLRHRMALGAAGVVKYSNMIELGNLLSQS
jgi:hypothetical protein